VIVRNIWQKLSSVEHKKMLIVKNYWQLFSQIFGEALLLSGIFGETQHARSLQEQPHDHMKPLHLLIEPMSSADEICNAKTMKPRYAWWPVPILM
jgi:hypothetical protein